MAGQAVAALISSSCRQRLNEPPASVFAKGFDETSRRDRWWG
ncbi:MAG: hypothetical protein ACYC3B_06535 [Sedimentisphaerales bacterium]